ncbi:MAG: hypothetical protein WCD18_16390 [Thermosynechococcaceae cyanobacterium]
MDNNDEPKHWIPDAIEETTDGISKLTPVLQAYWVGALLFVILMLSVTGCLVSVLLVWRSHPVDFNKLMDNPRGILTRR